MRDEVSHLCHTALRKLARPAGLEPATLGLEGRCSIRLSYGRENSVNRTTVCPRGRPQEGSWHGVRRATVVPNGRVHLRAAS